MADKVVVQATSSGKSPSTKAKITFSEEETEKLISLWSEEEVLFNCRCDVMRSHMTLRPCARLFVELNMDSLLFV